MESENIKYRDYSYICSCNVLVFLIATSRYLKLDVFCLVQLFTSSVQMNPTDHITNTKVSLKSIAQCTQ